jgi:hypothetical protein
MNDVLAEQQPFIALLFFQINLVQNLYFLL